jgi:hypothetical protein
MTEAIAREHVSASVAPHAPGRAAGWCWASAFAVVLLAHGWLSVRLFPSLEALVNDEPAIAVDHAIHLYHGYLGARFLKEHGTSWGYDPFFMAGYPKTPLYDSSSGPAELFQFVAGGGYSPRAYKLGVTALVALVPVAMAFAAWAYGLKSPATLAAVLLAGWYWWVGFPDMLVRTGLVAFVWASALAALAPPLLMRWGMRMPAPHAATSGGPAHSNSSATETSAQRRQLIGRSAARSVLLWCALCLATAAGVQAHSMFPVMVFLPSAVGYLLIGFRLGWRWHLATWAALGAALVATHFWWWPLLRFVSLKTGSDLFMKAEYWSFAMEYYLLTDGRIPLLLLVLGIAGLVHCWRHGNRIQAAVAGSQIIALALLTFAGSMWSVTRHLEPLRFQVPLNLALCLPAGQGMCALLAALDPRGLRAPGRVRGYIGAALLAVILLLLTFPATWWWALAGSAARAPDSTCRVALDRLGTARPVAVGLRPEMQALVEWIRENTDSSARILLEDQLRLWEPVEAESLHWTPLLPLLTGRQYVGGLYHLAFIPHRRAALGDWKLADRHIRSWSPSELRAFCEQYNIGWVITWSRASPRKEQGQPLSTEVFASLPFCERIATLPRHSTRPEEDQYAVFRVRREHTFFARGRGRVVRADYNRIELADLVPDSGQLILRYHWQDGFRAEPPLGIERAEDSGDAVGFIRIRSDRPIPRLLVWNGY